MTNPAECVRLGADAIAVAMGIFGASEGKFLQMLGSVVTAAAKYDLPVMAHIYPRHFSQGAKIGHDPESISWATRVGIEAGVEVIKVGYTGDVASFRQIVEGSPRPVIDAGGSKAKNLLEAWYAMAWVVETGGRGPTIGRNVWRVEPVTAALKSFKAVILDGFHSKKALAANGLSGLE
jgi:class I fructose-bisphosphate aldolase